MTSMFSRLTGGGSSNSNKDKKDEDLADTIVAPGSIRGESVFGEDVPFPEAQVRPKPRPHGVVVVVVVIHPPSAICSIHVGWCKDGMWDG